MSDRRESNRNSESATRLPGRRFQPLRETVVVVVHHRQPEELRACLQTLGEVAPDLRVVVVENGSRDQSVTAVRMVAVERSTVTLVEVPFCRGHTAGLNLGIDTALEIAPDLGQVLLLDVDSRVGPELVNELLGARRRHPEAGILGSNVQSAEHRASLFEQGRLQGRLSLPVRDASPAGGVECQVDFVDLGGVMLTAEFLAEGHRFDTGYFSHLAEVDLCRTARDAGFEVWVRRTESLRRSDGSPREIAWDPIAAQPTDILRRVAESRAYYCKKWLEPKWRVLGLLRLAVADTFSGLCWSLSRGGRPRFLSAWFEGLREGLSIALPGAGEEESDAGQLDDLESEGLEDGDFEEEFEDELEDEPGDGDWDDGDSNDGDWDDGDWNDDTDGEDPDQEGDQSFERGVGTEPIVEKSERRSIGRRGSSKASKLDSLSWLDDDSPSARSLPNAVPEVKERKLPDLFQLDSPEMRARRDLEADEYVVAFDDAEWRDLTCGPSSGFDAVEEAGDEGDLSSVFELFEEELEIVEHDGHLNEGRKPRRVGAQATKTARTKAEARPVVMPKAPGIRPSDLFRR
ncbi:MAG: glycosyltransferase [Planctomycetota bacterium]